MAPKRKLGFTLMELLMVIAVIGILASLMLPALKAAKDAARKKRAQVEASQIETALRSYYMDNRGWKDLDGTTDSGASMVNTLKGVGNKVPYLEFGSKNLVGGQMMDPWGKTYKIALCSAANQVNAKGVTLYRTCAVWSGGPNGTVENGDPEDSDDLVSWK